MPSSKRRVSLGDIACRKLRKRGARSWVASRSREKEHGEISGRRKKPWLKEEDEGNGGRWENVEMGRKELLRAGEWRADGCKRIY